MRKFIKIVVTVIALCHIGMAGAQEPVKKDSVLGFNAMDYLIQDIYRFPDRIIRQISKMNQESKNIFLTF